MSVLAEPNESAKRYLFQFVPLPKFPFTWVQPGIAVSDVLVIVAASIASYLLYCLILGAANDVEASLAVGMAVVIYFVPINVYRKNYSVDALVDTKRQVREIVCIWTFIFLLLASIGFLLKIGPNFSRGTTLIFYFVGLGLVLASRLVATKGLLLARARGAFAERKILLIANREQLAGNQRIQELERFGYRATKLFALSSRHRELTDAVIEEISQDPDIEDIVIVAGWEEIDCVDKIVGELRVLPINIRLLPDSKISQLLDKRGAQLGNVWTKELQRPPLNIEERAIKRSLDLMLGAVAGIALLPLMLIVALIIKLDSEGPVLFTQTRNGFNNRTFRILKFRTLNTLEDGANIKQVTRNDSRVTRVGRLLRRTSLDELPQLWNVICGDMSLVGPRPHATAHNSQYASLIANYAFRHHVKPGLTGWAQINGFRGETCTVELMKSRIELDLWYIDNWNLWLDIKVILRTFIFVLSQRAAY
jgi:Undecaprenyl-phosphate glucose phosphotransferase